MAARYPVRWPDAPVRARPEAALRPAPPGGVGEMHRNQRRWTLEA
ncbi:hypothetical protein [Streptomyces sp. ISL-10]|nr:hypothetical protein [Streptomyces sp. ISL-10]